MPASPPVFSVRAALAAPVGRLGIATLLVLALPAGDAAAANPLAERLGRGEVRVYTRGYEIPRGRTVTEIALAERLDANGYRRVRGRRPQEPGEYFWGFERFWIYRRAHRRGGDDHPAELLGLDLERGTGRILRAVRPDPAAPDSEEALDWLPHLEPEVLAESLAGDRAPRRPVRLAELPERVWRPLVAIEDHRFFDHPGVDARAVARAAAANARSGGVAQGGSTITQQLIKMRDLTPRRSLGRKVSEAVRALALEAEVDKEDILESYLDHVYYGHVEGVALHGIGTAAAVFFSKPAAELDLAEAALLAGIIRSPNRLNPIRHPEAARKRRDQVLARMEELGWMADEAARARRRPLALAVDPPRARTASHFLGWVEEIAAARAPRVEKGRGVVVETGLDPYLQQLAEEAVTARLAELARGNRRLREAPLAAALVAIDVTTGDVVAYVGGDPRGQRGGFDRVRRAKRQPGSAIKPLVLLEAFERCGARPPLTPATRVADDPVTVDLTTGPWRPANDDGRNRGTVDLRTALAESLNIPFVRVGRWCGFEATARRLGQAGLDLPSPAPPSLVLGAVEVTPLELARAYTVFATPGEVLTPRPVLRLELPGGRKIERFRTRRRQVTRAASAYLVADLLRTAAESGTARAAAVAGVETAAKTGTSSDRRDAWLAGRAGSLVTVVWVGRDDGAPLGLSGSAAAAPLWRAFMERAVPARPPYRLERPPAVVERWVDPDTGLLVRGWRSDAVEEIFRRRALPPRDRFYRDDEPLPVVR